MAVDTLSQVADALQDVPAPGSFAHVFHVQCRKAAGRWQLPVDETEQIVSLWFLEHADVVCRRWDATKSRPVGPAREASQHTVMRHLVSDAVRGPAKRFHRQQRYELGGL